MRERQSNGDKYSYTNAKSVFSSSALDKTKARIVRAFLMCVRESYSLFSLQ